LLIFLQIELVKNREIVHLDFQTDQHYHVILRTNELTKFPIKEIILRI